MLKKLSEITAARRRFLVVATDDTTGALLPAVAFNVSADFQINKNGAGFVNAAGTISNQGGGLYHYEATLGELDTLGYWALKMAKAGVRTTIMEHEVVAVDQNDGAAGGMSRLDVAVSTRAVPGGPATIDGATVTSIATAVDATLTAAHGSGQWAAGGIADAVWEELIADHQSVAGSFAESMMIMRGLAQNNFVLDNTTFDGAGLMTAGRIRVFSSAAAATAATQGGTGQGEIAAFAITATGSSGQASLYKSIRTA